ncbi:MAG: cytidine deaminase [Clostridia bacterium]|nr:cytidine deaminase [Clostridia bacterium]MDD4665097.1 cytidine deaminase [Clostridia bacterium]
MERTKEVKIESIDELIAAAKRVRANAYAPYSHFQVGAALLGSDGRIYTGCNVENASYGLSVCAERTAVFQAVSQGLTSFQALALVADSEEPVSPCGACRQILAEFSPEMPVLMVNLKGKIVRSTVEKLLPSSFTFKKCEEEKVK